MARRLPRNILISHTVIRWPVFAEGRDAKRGATPRVLARTMCPGTPKPKPSTSGFLGIMAFQREGGIPFKSSHEEVFTLIRRITTEVNTSSCDQIQLGSNAPGAY